MNTLDDNLQAARQEIVDRCTACGDCYRACLVVPLTDLADTPAEQVLPGVLSVLKSKEEVPQASLDWAGYGTRCGACLDAFASQAAAYVIDIGAILTPEHVAESYRGAAREYPGESCIIDPVGEIIAGPAEGETILVADCSMENIFAAKSLCDVAGHYARPDVFQFQVKT